MSEFSERLKAYRSRFSLRDQSTQLTLAGLLAVVVLIAAAVGWSGNGPATATNVAGSSSGDDTGALGSDVPDSSTGPGVVTPRQGTGGSAVVNHSGATVDAPDAPDAPPLTASSMKVGIAYTSDAGSSNEAAGFGAIQQVNQRRGWDALIKDYNKDPPFGRKVVPVYFAVTENDITSKGSERLQQEACAHYTQDNRVFMVWEGVIGGDVLSACLTKARIPALGGGAGLSYSKTYEDYPYLISPADAAMDRMARFEIDQLFEHGYFSKFKENQVPYTPQKPADGKPKIGLIRYDQPSYKAGAAAMKDELAKHHLAFCAGCEFEVSYSADNVQEQLDDATEVNAAIQNFKSKGVTHVVFLGSTAGVRITLFYVDGAEKQQYRARLGFNPLDAPNAVRDFYEQAGQNQNPQFVDSMIVTTDPGNFDVRSGGFAVCKKIFSDAGETFGEGSSNKEGQIPLYCDDAWYTRAVANAVGADLRLQTFMHGVETMTPAQSASTYLMQTKTGRHDGAGAIRVGGWVPGCTCFKPSTGIIPV